MHILTFTAIASLTTAVLQIVTVARKRRARMMPIIEQWARDNGYEIVRVRVSMPLFAPPGLPGLRTRLAYKVTVRDASGQTLTAWTRCGACMFSRSEQPMTVVWA